MSRLYVLVEGQTEEEFARGVLAPHLHALGCWVVPIVVQSSRDRFGGKRRGGGHWKHWFKDLRRLCGEHAGDDVAFTTLFDLYGLPSDFPGLKAHAGVVDTAKRAALLEESLAEAVGDQRLIPYIQRHEFEALVLAALDQLENLLDVGDRPGIQTLRPLLVGAAPEDINDGEGTAPSKRITAAIPAYVKTLHGPVALMDAGLARIRSQCPRFDAWLGTLEALSVQLR